MVTEHIVLAFLWIVFCALHSLLAGSGLKKKLALRMGAGFRYYRLFYTLFAFLSLGGVVYYQLAMTQWLLFVRTQAVEIGGYVLAGCGLVLMLVCIKKYFAGLSGIRSLYSEPAPQPLLITGVHRFMRHPLYMGTFAFIWGLFLLFPYASLLIANTIITLYTLLGIELEEAKLVDEFGDEYRRYRQTVPKLLPFRRARQ
jgi:protein-S-isoprenylcysteine O-methyltransferase Ste14